MAVYTMTVEDMLAHAKAWGDVTMVSGTGWLQLLGQLEQSAQLI